MDLFGKVVTLRLKKSKHKFLEEIGCYQSFVSKFAELYVATILVK